MSYDAFPSKRNNPDSRVVSGSFAPNGSSAIDSSKTLGRGIKSVTYVSTGLYKVKLEDNFDKLKSWSLSIQLSAAADKKLQLGTVDLAASGGAELQIRSVAVGSVSDIAADASNRVSFEFEFGIGTN